MKLNLSFSKATRAPIMGVLLGLGLGLGVGLADGSTAKADSLDNLMRARALMLSDMLNPSLTAHERSEKMQGAKRRIVDYERLALRDDELKGKNTPTIRWAFSNYDLAFLGHASLEKNRLLSDHWLEQLGITTHAIMNADSGWK